MIDYKTFLSPSKARQLYDGSRERSIASHALRQAWHYIFDFCPILLSKYPPSGKDFLDGFLDMCEKDGTSLNWKIFFKILDLHRKRGDLYEELSTELMMAAAIRWSLSDFSRNQSIYIVEKQFGFSVLGEKSLSLDSEKSFQVFSYERSEISNDIFYSVSVGRRPEDHEDWESVYGG